MKQQASLARELEAAIDWWRQSGVDYDFSETAVDRLAMAAAEASAAAAQKTQKPEKSSGPAASPAGTRQFMPRTDMQQDNAIVSGSDGLPGSLDAFVTWWKSDQALNLAGSGERVAPYGCREAQLMVLVSSPEEGDRERLLSGAQGRLVSGFLRAAAIDPAECYFASALPCPMALPDWTALGKAGLGTMILHHIGLAAPKRVLAFGRNILPLIGHDAAQGPAQVSPDLGKGESVPVLGAPGLEELLRSPQRRKKLWRDWLDWTTL